MKNLLLKVAALGLCAGLLPNAQRHNIEYRVWAGAPSNVVNGPADATYVFDGQWRQRAISSDEWILARRSSTHIQLRSEPGRWAYSLGGKLTRSECDGGPFRWIISPSGLVYGCVDDYFPSTTLHVFRSRDRRPIATLKLETAYVEGRDRIAFLDDDRVAFSSIDAACPQERETRLRRSIEEISIAARFPRRTLCHCASSVIVGTRRVAYLREANTQYSLDGANWVSQELYALDQDDNPIAEDSPVIQKFKSSHPGLAVWLISVGEAPHDV